jgi:DNA polymerase III delta subunit
MITLLHGDDMVTSRAEFFRLKSNQKSREVREFDGRKIDETTLIQSLESASLFGGDITVIIENLFSRLGKNPKKIAALGKILSNCPPETEIVIWEDKEVGKTVQSALGTKTNIRLFKIPTLIFQFLDGLKPNNCALSIPQYHELIRNYAPEQIFVMVVKRVRHLIMLNSNVNPADLQGWQIGRLTSQAKLFTMKKLTMIYKHLLEIDFSIKSGNSALGMNEQLELWLCDLVS